MFGNPIQLIRSYSPLEVFIEVAVIWIFVYAVFRFLRGTRGAGIFKGLVVLLVLLTLITRVLGQASDAFGRLNFIYDRFLGLLAILLIVVFQPELRQAMVRLGQARGFLGPVGRMRGVIDAISEAVNFLSKNQFGALIAIERSVKLGALLAGGQQLDAKVSARLIESIFWPNSPLHDLGVVIREDRVIAAGVQFPLAEEGVLPPHTGSRHRAAAGLTFESDSLVIIVSEETGTISLAENGKVEFDVSRDDFARILAKRLKTPPTKKSETEAEPEQSDAADMAEGNTSGEQNITDTDSSLTKSAELKLEANS